MLLFWLSAVICFNNCHENTKQQPNKCISNDKYSSELSKSCLKIEWYKWAKIQHIPLFLVCFLLLNCFNCAINVNMYVFYSHYFVFPCCQIKHIKLLQVLAQVHVYQKNFKGHSVTLLFILFLLFQINDI